MDTNTYRDMHLLNELARNPGTTQRELAKRIGVALGLTNLMLRRLLKKGYIKITGTKRSRIRYLITPQGILEKSRLTYEFIEYSLALYSRVRRFLREQLVILAQTGHRRVLLYGTGELAELAFLAVREIGLDLVGVVDLAPEHERFLGYPVRRVHDVSGSDYDRMIVSSWRAGDGGLQRLMESGVAPERLIILPIPGMPSVLPEGLSVVGTAAAPSDAQALAATPP
ncbi:MAG: winged helix-turn-helix transcriptional regulator [Candidatus Rokubacteria bacterium]|nr:winged helix-turn-helix transcriptional regulator [Candidatus Rokubacteria bacterium]